MYGNTVFYFLSKVSLKEKVNSAGICIYDKNCEALFK